MSFTASLFSISEGFMIVGGRVFELTASESISVSPGTGFARVIVTIDTSAASTETEFEQVSLSVDYAANIDNFSELQKGPININQGPAIYQAAVAVLNINSTGITGIEAQMEIVTPGGTSLNFSVVGSTTQPTSPKENTVWVNTDTAISEWIFSATQPTNPVEGKVWFNIGTSSNTPINALKKNGLWVYPTACQQYISGTWVAKEAKTYQGGVWVSWELYLIENGALAGDYSLNGLTQNSDNIQLSIPGSTQTRIGYVTPMIDVTPFTTMELTFDVVGGTTASYVVGLKSDTTANTSFAAAKKGNFTANTSTVTATVDISSVSGEMYLAAYGKSASAACNVYLKDVKLC